jgi:hypothetical protein
MRKIPTKDLIAFSNGVLMWLAQEKGVLKDISDTQA